jgi:hypothetical protein
MPWRFDIELAGIPVADVVKLEFDPKYCRRTRGESTLSSRLLRVRCKNLESSHAMSFLVRG